MQKCCKLPIPGIQGVGILLIIFRGDSFRFEDVIELSMDLSTLSLGPD